MNIKKKLIYPFFIVAALSMALPAHAQTIINDKEDIITIAKNISTWLYRIFFVIAVLYILFAAFTYLTAKDDATKVKKAQTSLKNAVIAIIIALLSTGASLLISQFITP